MKKYGIKNYLILGIILIALVTIFFPDAGVWAAQEAAKTSNCEKTLVWLSTLAKLFSWLWIIPAILAGKLMTNDFVFGGVFHLDVYLWQVWNTMKNFANYLIGFVFLYLVIKTFFKNESVAQLGRALPKILISAILVQSSWFIMGALVDMSNILTASVGSFVSQFVNNSEYKGYIENMKSRIPQKIVLKSSSDPEGVIGTSEGTSSIKLEKILPTADSLSGPLLFFGLSVLRFQDYNYANENQNSCGVLTFSEFFKHIVVILFVVPLILLLVINVIRMVYIWFWTILSPFVIVYSILKQDIKAKAMGSIDNKVNFGSIIGLIFLPPIVVAGLGLSMILVIGFDSMILQGNTNSNSNVINLKGSTYEQLSEDEAKITVPFEGMENPPSITLKGNIFKNLKNIGGGLIGYILVTSMILFLIWSILKLCFSASKLTENISNQFFGFVEGMAKVAPIVPMPGGAVGIGAIARGLGNIKSEAMSPAWQNQANEFLEKSGLGNVLKSEGDINYDEMPDLKQIISSSTPSNTIDFFSKLKSVVESKKKPISVISSPKFKEILYDWAKTDAIKNYFISNQILKKEDFEDVDKLMNNQIFSNYVIQLMDTPSNLAGTVVKPQSITLKSKSFGGNRSSS